MKKIYIMALCLMIGVTGMLLSGCSKKINISEYIEITSEGANGYGSIETSLKKSELATEIYGEELEDFDLEDIKDLGDAADAYKEYSEKAKEYRKVKDMLDDIEIVLDKRQSLKNGDVVKIMVTMPETVEDELNVSFRDTEFEYTVSGLKEVETIDAFAEDVMSIEYEGASPDVSLKVTNIAQESPADTIYYEVDSDDSLKDGDQVTITAEYDEDDLLDAGYIVKESQKTITVESDYKYVETAADLTGDFDTKLKDQALDTVKSYIAEKNVKNMTWTCKGKYVCNFKGTDLDWSETQNVIYYVFYGKIVPKEKGYKSKSVYMAVRYEDVIVGKDGTSTYIPSEHAERMYDGTEYMDIGGWDSVQCYLSEQNMFDNCVQKYTDRYNYEVSDDLKDLG